MRDAGGRQAANIPASRALLSEGETESCPARQPQAQGKRDPALTLGKTCAPGGMQEACGCPGSLTDVKQSSWATGRGAEYTLSSLMTDWPPQEEGRNVEKAPLESSAHRAWL